MIDSRWVLKRKIESGNSVRYKARLVKEVLRIINAPVSRLPLIQTILAIANKCDFHICQMDVKTALFERTTSE